MNTNLLFDFSVDKENKTINVKREFAANLDLVWKAWTTAELLDRWWAPKPYQTQTKSMDFREGGYWLYAMISPAEEKHWCRADFKTIEILKSFSALDAFCDENGNVTLAFPRSFWTNVFNENAESTAVNISIVYEKLEDLEKIIEMGFKEGFTMGLGNLDELLATLTEQNGG
jgi:PhnB protein